MSTRLPNFDWTRFWVSRDSYLILDDDGFLADPEGRHGPFRNSSALSVEAVLSRRCAVLLGEPGIGKSTELEQVNRQVISTFPGAEILEFNLKDYSSENLLVKDLFEDSKFQGWSDGSHELLLSLDSLDECILRIETVAGLLSKKLGRYSIDRLRLRIACRTAAWPKSFEDALIKLWGQEQFGVFELLPLRRKDVEAAATVSGVRAEAFLKEVTSRQAVPFAIKPLTLRFLLEKFRRDLQLPDKIEEVYLEGCRWLCTETNLSRVETGRSGSLTADQRLAVAGRLAALTLYAGRAAISQEAPVDLLDSDLSIQEAIGGTEEESGQVVEITRLAISETLDTGLFSSRGRSRLSWSHQTYAEFLAARYVARHGFDTAQKLSLVTSPDRGSRLVIPQLVQATVCLVNLDPSLFDELVQDSPQVLLRSEASSWNAYQRFALTSSFLKLVAELKITDRDAELRKGFAKLDHPGLAKQLEPYIRDSAANSVVRRVAIGIASACNIIPLREALLETALDQSDDHPTRVQAIRALREIGDLESKRVLLGLLDSNLSEDHDDQIRGSVLSQSWPTLLSFDKLVTYITCPKDQVFLGAYRVFLEYEVVKGLQPSDIPRALLWAAEKEGRLDLLSPFLKTTDLILREGFRHVDDPTIYVALIVAVEARLKARHSLWKEDFFDESEADPLRNVQKRHLLIQGIVERASDNTSLSRLEIIRSLREDDLSWLILQALTAPAGNEKEKWVLLVKELFLTNVKLYWNLVLEASLQNKVLADALTYWIGPIGLDSPEADFQKRNFSDWQENQLEQEEGAPVDSLPQIESTLQEIEAGNLQSWWSLDDLLGSLRDGGLGADIRIYATWQHLEEQQRSRVVRAARRYIAEADDPSRGGMSSRFGYQDLASFRALYLVATEDHEFIKGLTLEVICRWTPIILRKTADIDDNAESYLELLRIIWQMAPDLVAEKISQAIAEQNLDTPKERPLLDMQLHICWNETMEIMLVDMLNGGTLKPSFEAYLVDVLLAKESALTEPWALQLLSNSIPEGKADQERQFRVA